MVDQNKALLPDDEKALHDLDAAKPLAKHTVAAGDSLSKIAAHYYGDSEKWKVIYEANKTAIGDNPNQLKVGQQLIIPKLA